MPDIQFSSKIADVQTVSLRIFGDDRGRFMETFRREWFPQRSWEAIQTNRSDSTQGVIRGLHYHFKQVDYWCVIHGMIRAVLVDIRPNSPTFKQIEIIDMNGDMPIGLFIPVGVAHGFATISERVTLTYVVDNYYDSTDEHGVAWNDPDLAIDWGVSNPIISPRDEANPCFRDIDPSKLPDYRPIL